MTEEISFDEFQNLFNSTEVTPQEPFSLDLETEEQTSTEEIQEPEQTEIVEETPEEAKPEEEKPQEQAPSVATEYTSIAKKFLDSGEWEDVLIDDGNGNEVKLSEVENLDADMFFEIYNEQKAAIKEDIKENYVSVKDLPEDKKKLISIITNGGDLKEVFQSEQELKRPFEGMDLEDNKVQQNILYWYYTQNQGLDQDEAVELVKTAVKNLSIPDKVEKIVKTTNELFDKNLEAKAKAIQEAKVQEEQAIKDFAKGLRSEYKSDGLEDALTKRLVEAATKKDASGEFIVDVAYEKAMKDPKEAKELIMFLLEKEKFLKLKGAEVKREAAKTTMRTVKLLKDTKKTSTTPEAPEQPKNIFEEFRIE